MFSVSPHSRPHTHHMKLIPMPRLQHASMPATPRTVELKQRSLDSKLASAFPSILSTPRSASTSSTASSSSASSSSSQYSGSDSESDCPARCTPPKSTLPSTPKVPRHQRSAVAAVQDASELFRLDIPQEAVDFSLCLGSSPCSKTKGKSSAEAGPPAFFPGQRISFSPKLRVLQKSGLRLDPCVMSTKNGGVLDEVYEVPHPSEERLCGMMLGLTGVVEMLNPPSKSNPQSTVKSSRVIADYCTDLTSGMKVWHRDASMAEKNRSGRLTNRKRLPCGTYVLPLTMRLPNSEKLSVFFLRPPDTMLT